MLQSEQVGLAPAAAARSQACSESPGLTVRAWDVISTTTWHRRSQGSHTFQRKDSHGPDVAT